MRLRTSHWVLPNPNVRQILVVDVYILLGEKELLLEIGRKWWFRVQTVQDLVPAINISKSRILVQHRRMASLKKGEERTRSCEEGYIAADQICPSKKGYTFLCIYKREETLISNFLFI